MGAKQLDSTIVFPWEKEQDFELCIVYDKSFPWPDHPAFTSFVEGVYKAANIDDLITAKSAKAVVTARESRMRELSSLLWHCYAAHTYQGVVEDFDSPAPDIWAQYKIWLDETGSVESISPAYIRISLNKNDYKVSDPDNPFRITSAVSKILHRLKEHGFIEFQPGYHIRNPAAIAAGAEGKETRFRPDNRLEGLLNALPAMDVAPRQRDKPVPDVFKRYANANGHGLSVGQGKAQPKNLKWRTFEYHPICPILKANSVLVDRYNTFIEKQRLTMVTARGGRFLEPLGKGKVRVIDLSNIFIRNIYHVNDDGHVSYGRMHGGFWQGIKSDHRHGIRINGRSVVILDYKAMILNIVAAQHGMQLAGDPYDVDFGFANYAKKLQRQMVKSAVIIAINSQTEVKGYFAAREQLNDDFWDVVGLAFPKSVFDDIIAALLKRHPFLDNVFFKRVGKDIFMEDAVIARDIVERFLDAGKVVLPIHDGFVAQMDNKHFLRKAMEDAWRDRFGTSIALDEE